MQRHPARLLLAAMTLVIAAPVCQAQTVGKLAVAQNKVFSLKPGATERVQVSVGSPVVLNETETTDRASRAKFIFGEGALVSIGQNTTFKVSQSAVDEATGAATSRVEVEEGRLRVFVSRFWTGRPKVQVDTPTAVVGIKGSEVMVEVFDGKTIVTVFGGTAEVRSRTGSGGAATVVAGQQTNVSSSGPGSPVNVAPGTLASLWSSTEPVPDPPVTPPTSPPARGTPGGGRGQRAAAAAAVTACVSCGGTTSFSNPAVEATRDAPGSAGKIVNSGNKAGWR